MTRPKLRRLIDLPGISDLELKALMKRDFAEPDARDHYPEIDEASKAAMGLTMAEAEAVERPEGWDNIERRPVAEQVEAFEAEGWDVTDDRRKPLRMFEHLNEPLWLAIRGVAGELPFQPDDETPDAWGSGMASEAKRFRKR